MGDDVRIRNLQQQGYCCTQIMLKMGLEDAGLPEEPALIKAAAGLCGGMHSGLVCGILSGACALLALLLPEKTAALCSKITEWFSNEFKAENDSIDCKDLIPGGDLDRFVKCPRMLAATYAKVKELLEEHDFEFADDD